MARVLRHCVLICLVIFLCGCLGPAIVPPKERIANVKRVHVVAMETHPLTIPASVRTWIIMKAPPASLIAVRGIGVFNTIPISLEIQDGSQPSDDVSESLQAAMDAKGAYAPTVVLANDVVQQLAANGFHADVAAQVKPMPGVTDRHHAGAIMENWMAPIRVYYNDLATQHDYRALESNEPFVVLEASILNYEIAFGGLLLQVQLKMIDPLDGRVIGRARAANVNRADIGNLSPLDYAFANGGSRFKEIFSKKAHELVTACLVELALVSPR